MIMDYKQVKADVLKQYDSVMPLIQEIKGNSATTFDTQLTQLQMDVDNEMPLEVITMGNYYFKNCRMCMCGNCGRNHGLER